MRGLYERHCVNSYIRTYRTMSTRLLSIAILFCWILAVCVNVDAQSPNVQTSVGRVTGSYKTSAGGRKYAAYEGIPYAYPPIGDRRFEPPTESPPWEGELMATSYKPNCLQYNLIEQNPILGSEDCLYLNVYVPERENTSTLLSVFFSIYGGAFTFGIGGRASGPDFLMDHDVIVVLINYRVGPFGFLSTEDEVVPGNMGLKDQNMALRWVVNNIEYFTGNPKQITLVGTDAGGASVHLHYLSPMSAGLFQRGISVSGTALNCWAQTENSLNKAKQLSQLMGCTTSNSKDMIACLKNCTGTELLQHMPKFMPFYKNPFTPFGPVVEEINDAYFMNMAPIDIINGGGAQNLPWIASSVSEEGIYPITTFLNKADYMQNLNNDWNSICPLLFDFNYTAPQEQHATISQSIRKHYFGTSEVNKENFRPLIKLATDRLFLYDSQKAAKIQAEKSRSSVWYYHYSYRGTDSLSKILSGSDENYGVSHDDDIFTILKTPWIKPTTTDDLNMQKHLMRLYLSFVINGEPSVANVKWNKVDPSKEFEYLHLAGPNNIAMSNIKLVNERFWDNINLNENKI